MTITKMLMMLVVIATLFCNHHQVIVAKKVALVDEGSESLSSFPFDLPQPRPQPRPQPFSPPPPPRRSPSPPPPRSPPPPPPRLPPPPAPTMTCSASDQQQVKTCMYETTSIDACPIFKKILGTSCPCYKYANDLDNQILITLEAYCDVSTPCKGVQVIKLFNDEQR
uniref:Bifunctional inhibitor/plant lipid transfer protein/seed storage helical domain-containing protein n=1 Tax=Solanum lycopersicum TaxID=4081 RepID=A0A3Q7E7V3_SOLLC